MNTPGKIVLASTAGTTMMTSFSYAASLLADENFSEPEHLGTMINRLYPGHSKKLNYIAGWGAHYAIGVLFALIYQELWKTGKIKKSVRNGLILGAISGGWAVLSWKMMFKKHPAPPRISFRHFYAQLVPAHIIFAVVTTIAYRLLEERAKDQTSLSVAHHTI